MSKWYKIMNCYIVCILFTSRVIVALNAYCEDTVAAMLHIPRKNDM